MTDDKLTPMFRQWQAAKARYPDALLLFRMGDFYEMFAEDAETGARELELTLTSRECGQGRRIPMCGVPHHAVQRYVQTLIKKGYRAAVCEQVEDPKHAKGLVRRDVTRVVTPGTLLEDEFLDGSSNNYLASVAHEGAAWGIASVDISTGDFAVTEIAAQPPSASRQGLLNGAAPREDRIPGSVAEELSRIEPAEVIAAAEIAEVITARGGPHVTVIEPPADALVEA